VRVDVADANPMLPFAPGYEVDSVTGRGLSLLELLPSAWGVQPVPGGKIVWFELPLDIPIDLVDLRDAEESYGFDLEGQALATAGLGRTGTWELGATALDPLASALPLMAISKGSPVVSADGVSVPLGSDGVTRLDGNGLTDFGLFGLFGLFVFELKGAPALLMQQATEHYEALFREFRLIVEQDEDPEHPRTLPRHLRDVITILGTRFSGFGWPVREDWFAAIEDGKLEVDLSMALPCDAGAQCLEFDRLLDEADEYCRAADLITLPADHACTAFRQWVLNEAARQATGHPPQRWARTKWSKGIRRARLMHPAWASLRHRN
jgi:hypothetical protein